jgi:hypothetical protein
MTRKFFDYDDDNDNDYDINRNKLTSNNNNGINDDNDLLNEEIEQLKFEKSLKEEYEKTETFTMKNFDQLYDLFQDIKNNSNNDLLFSNCQLQDLGDFIYNLPNIININNNVKLKNSNIRIPLSYSLDNDINYIINKFYNENKFDLCMTFRTISKYSIVKNKQLSFSDYIRFIYRLQKYL